MRPLPEVPSAAAPADGEQAGAALVEHYPRLVRLGYLVLPPSLGSHRRVLKAHALAQRCLLSGRRAGAGAGIPAPRGPGGAAAVDPSYAHARRRVLRAALAAGRPRPGSGRARLPSLLPLVWGLRLFPHSGGSDGLALENALSALSGPGRAAHALRGLEGLADAEARRVLADAGVADPYAALAEAAGVPAPYALLGSPEFDPCSLQARPPDLLRRRRYAKAVLAAAAALLVCGALLGLPGEGWGRGAPSGAQHTRAAVAGQALDPGRVSRVSSTFWRRSTRTDFTAWPTRGNRAGDTGLLRRALTVWAHPDDTVRSSATPDTPVGPPMGAPQLLYAGEVDRVAVVLFHDGLRVVRYAEPLEAGRDEGVTLDFARVDGADRASAVALIVARAGDRIRYLTAPWVTAVSVRDLLAPGAAPRPLRRGPDGVTTALTSPATARGCRAWEAVEVRDGRSARLMADLGELAPARLTSGPPSAPHDVTGRAERDSWARTACLLPAVRSYGVRSVNSWQYAVQSLPEGNGSARWLCTRAETWRGTGSRVLAQFQAPSAPAAATGGPPGAVAARAEDSPACGARDPRVLAGVLWKSQGGRWYVLAAGSSQFASLTASGGVVARSDGRLLAAPARAGDRARLNGTLVDGSRAGALR
ncbi:hypothetical protein OG298_29880 [Streptomyces sp. NBC_01005]|uniref:hypothetical protein n=1 Tax=unclassified Streptomyces TaxID=2593676 RepID=UPI002E36464F|nr:hypothetical protein [Streptomyces sp. NBC_01362]WSW08242.1 hypothetical protein OG298_29880 [Streptomyces sp. NBC_01005]WTC97750.1 hypothetical protein OH736_29890 [Streptomyces sp. NBC_01650]